LHQAVRNSERKATQYMRKGKRLTL